MIVSENAKFVSLRVGPGANLLDALGAILDEQHADGGALIAAAGSLEFLRYSVVKPDEENVPRYTEIIEETGAIEITGLQGHLGREADGSATCHLHGTFALGDGTVRAGHVYDARVLVTVELTVLLSHGLAWKRSVVEYGAGKTMPVLLPMQSLPAHDLPAAAHSEQAV